MKLDGWLALAMSASVAARLVLLRPALEQLLVQAADDPEILSAPRDEHRDTVELVRELCRPDSGRHGMEAAAGGAGRGQFKRGRGDGGPRGGWMPRGPRPDFPPRE